MAELINYLNTNQAIKITLFGYSPDEELRLLNNQAVHWWYEFPQDFPSSLVWDKLREYEVQTGATVLDPFAGSGTTLVTSKFVGCNAVGIEVIPLLAFICEAKTFWDFGKWYLEDELSEFLSRLTTVRQDYTVSQGEIEEIGMPAKTLTKWLEPQVIAQAIQVRKMIAEFGEPIRPVLDVAFSKSLYDASNVKYAPGITFLKKKNGPSLTKAFTHRLGQIAEDIRLIASYAKRHSHMYGQSKVVCGDSREANKLLPSNSVDFLFTSPPYPGDVEYTRLFRLEMYFLDFVKSLKEVQSIKRQMVRSTPKNIFKQDNNERFVNEVRIVQEVSNSVAEAVKGKQWGWDYPRMVREYFGDMYLCLLSFKAVLKPGAYALLVVGEQTVKGALIPTGEILKQIGERLGYSESRLEFYRHRRASTHSRPLAEHIVILRK